MPNSEDILATPVTPGKLEAKEIRNLLGKDNPLILEVGANRGQTTAAFLQAMPGATIHAFEPDPRAIAKFRERINHPQVHLEECAVGAVIGTTIFHQSSGAENKPEYRQGWDQSGSIRAPRGHVEVWPWVKFKNQIEVPIITLDFWAAGKGISAVDFVWADVQGAESDLVEGAARLLSSTRFFYTEYSNSELYAGQIDLPGLAAMLPDFDLDRRYPMDVLFRNRRLA